MITMAQLAEKDIANIMKVANQYERMHHAIVYKKLCHAKMATQKCYEDLNGIQCNDKTFLKVQATKKRYSKLWETILKRYGNIPVMQDTILGNIEKMLENMPHMIREIYHRLVKNDVELQQLITKIQKKTYQSAIVVMNDIQRASRKLMGDIWPEKIYIEMRSAEKSRVEFYNLDNVMVRVAKV
jgi:CRISPR/Cas system-associated protein endoribonuclease Cas2